MNKELIDEVTQWILTSNKSHLPYEFHAKAIIKLCADEAITAIQEEPEYISSSHSTRHGYVRAVNDMQRAIEKRMK